MSDSYIKHLRSKLIKHFLSQIVAGITQYMLLCVFAWTFVQAFLLYSTFVVVFDGGFETQYSRSVKATYAAPLLIMIISLTTSWEDYSTNKVQFKKDFFFFFLP